MQTLGKINIDRRCAMVKRAPFLKTRYVATTTARCRRKMPS
jgi:hypothetical protein